MKTRTKLIFGLLGLFEAAIGAFVGYRLYQDSEIEDALLADIAAALVLFGLLLTYLAMFCLKPATKNPQRPFKR